MYRIERRNPPGRLPGRLALLLFAALLAGPPPAGAAEPALLAVVEGQVELGLGDPPQFRPARAGEVLPEGAVVRTGPDARAEVRHGDDTLRLYGDTLLRLEPGADRTRVELERGRSLFDVLPGKQRGFEVRTREVAVLVKGTRFLVDAEGTLVTVFRGLVGVDDLLGGDDEIDVHAGLSLVRAAAGGPFELHVTPFADPWESWPSKGPAPLFEVPVERREPKAEAAGEVRQAMAESRRPSRSRAVEELAPERLDPVLDVPRDLAPRSERAVKAAAGGSSGDGALLPLPIGNGAAGDPGDSGQDPSQSEDSQGLVGSLLEDVLGPGGLVGGLLGGSRGDDDD